MVLHSYDVTCWLSVKEETNGANAPTTNMTLDTNPSGRNPNVKILCTMEDVPQREAIKCKEVDNGLR